MKFRLLPVALAATLALASCANQAKVDERTEAYKAVMDSLSTKINEYVMANLPALQADDSLAVADLQVLLDEVVDYNKTVFEKNRGNELGAVVFTAMYRMLENDEEVLEYGKKLSKKALAQNEQAQSIINAVTIRRATAEGEMFTDFEVVTVEGFDEDGNEIAGSAKLSDYVGQGKYILVDFWASWCGPCRGEIPNIKNVYETYAGEKFDVLSIAVWDHPEDSFKAIEEEGATWNQMVVSVDSRTVPTDAYGIEGIPQIILFGPDGKIVKRDLRGEAIAEAVAEAIAE